MAEIICYAEDQAFRDFQESWEIAILRSVNGVIDLNAYKAKDGNEESRPEINVLQSPFLLKYVFFFSVLLIFLFLIETWIEGSISLF